MFDFFKNKSKTISTPLEEVKMKIKISLDDKPNITSIKTEKSVTDSSVSTESLKSEKHNVANQYKINGNIIYIDVTHNKVISNNYLKVVGYSKRTNNYVYEYIGSTEPSIALKGIGFGCRLIPKHEIKFL